MSKSSVSFSLAANYGLILTMRLPFFSTSFLRFTIMSLTCASNSRGFRLWSIYKTDIRNKNMISRLIIIEEILADTYVDEPLAADAVSVYLVREVVLDVFVLVDDFPEVHFVEAIILGSVGRIRTVT